MNSNILLRRMRILEIFLSLSDHTFVLLIYLRTCFDIFSTRKRREEIETYFFQKGYRAFRKRISWSKEASKSENKSMKPVLLIINTNVNRNIIDYTVVLIVLSKYLSRSILPLSLSRVHNPVIKLSDRSYQTYYLIWFQTNDYISLRIGLFNIRDAIRQVNYFLIAHKFLIIFYCYEFLIILLFWDYNKRIFYYVHLTHEQNIFQITTK